MDDRKAELVALVGQKSVLDDPETLNKYSRDQSFTQAMKPQMVVKPKDVFDVQKIVGWANKTQTPLVPVSSGPPHFHGDTVPSVPGALIVDLSDMKKIMGINRRNRMAIVEPGVTYSELQPALAREGLRLSTSLLPRTNKSVLASLLEREPRLNCRYQWASLDPLRCLEIVWGDGNRFWSGDAGSDPMDLEKQWSQEKRQVEPAGAAQTDFYRFLSGAQGSMGIATWASVKCEVFPKIQKLFFVPADKLNDLTDFVYQLLRFRYADELFLLNNASLAYILGKTEGQIISLKSKFPEWIAIVTIAGRTELPEERVEFQEKDIQEIAQRFSLDLKPEISGVVGAEVLSLITNPSREPYWKLNYKGGCQDVFFITTLDRTPEFIKTMSAVSEKVDYPISDIGIYLQPRHQGVNLHCEFNLPYNPEKSEETARMRELYLKASEELANQGAFFTRPYGIWANLAFSRDAQSTALMKNIKSVFDPNGIMNPGKLCFEIKKTEVR